MYITYEEYIDMGGCIDWNKFNRLEAKARAHLDRVTFGRLAQEKNLPDAVKYCMFDILNAVQEEENTNAIAQGREIASMSNDGVAVTFASTANTNAARTSAARYAAIVRTWLMHETTANGIPLLYAGV